ncbi:diacylglycerol kinase family protein [Jeotgalibacillus sp. R-1-5s-1]|uniref:diacylglycerol/lipid kinase family protein n=1 Tax=Jeotgalibacillus sp. R-1-5s-1 TaxID=2555897 RepID=UPI00106BD5FD|nr:diacylglycerol kinase family protein [Jeotgalibacillus sp. R-1-5s-1]TFD98305.1 diacylglycerol kinase family lipid kinase [Jeotgalibacillus sp. R-1-5s-1]
MYQKAMLIYKGSAGEKEIEKLISQTAGVLAASIPALSLYQTQKPGDAERFCRQHGEEVDLVVIMGGDGTVHECVNGLAPLDKRPVIGIIPAGTCNDFARSLNIPLNIKRAAELIVHGGTEKPVDLVESNGRYFSNFWGTGLIAEASQNINDDSKNVFGRISYYVSAIKSLSGQEDFHYQLEVDQKVVEGEAVMLLVMNGKSIGATEFPLASIDLHDGLMDLLILKESGFPLFKEILAAKAMVDWDTSNSDILHYQCKELTVSLGKSQVIDMDGEHYEGQNHHLVVEKDCLRIVVPEIPHQL